MDETGEVAERGAPEGASAIEEMAHEAHRRPAYAVCAPAVLRHRTFHFKDRSAVRRSVFKLLQTLPSGEARDRKFNLLDSIFFEIKIADPGLEDLLSGWRLRARIEIHAEYLSLAFVVDSFKREGAPRPTTLRFTLDAIAQADCTPETVNAAVDALFDRVWQNLDDKLGISNLDFLGDLIADFRGVVIIPAPFAPLKLGENEVQLPDGDTTRDRRECVVDAKVRDFVRNRQNFLAKVLDLGSKDPPVAQQNANVVMCGMLNGAAIYGSSLGAGIDRGFRAQRYFVAYNGLSANQLGRFLRRLHVQGEVRMAALLDLVRLREASEKIRATGKDLDFYTERFEGTPSNQAALRDFFKRWTEIGKDCSGGLVYRVNQSRHYAQAFRERMEDLRIVRIEGWQPYDEFVRRNLYKSYDFISRIGERYDTLGRRIENLNVLQQTQSIEKNTGNVRDLTHQLVKLLGVAEIVGWAAFIFYVGTILGTALHVCALHACYEHQSYLAVPQFARITAQDFDLEQAKVFGWTVMSMVVFLVKVFGRLRGARKGKAAYGAQQL